MVGQGDALETHFADSWSVEFQPFRPENPMVAMIGKVNIPFKEQPLVGGFNMFNHLEKYESMGRIIPYVMENKSHVPNHQPDQYSRRPIH
jgi:hypothetical protein